jgi:hypothetical protein
MAMPSSGSGRSVPELFSDLVNQSTTLFRKEIQLARTEISEKINEAISGLGIVIAGAVLMIAALGVFLMGIAELVAWLGLDRQWAFLAVGLVAAGAGYLLVRSGLSNLSPENLKPTKTVEQLQRDAVAAKEQVS